MAQTNLIGRKCTANKEVNLWPWRTSAGVDMATRAEIVCAFDAAEVDGSSGIKFTLMALDGPVKGQLDDVYPRWVVIVGHEA